jgi:ribosome-associated protein
MKNIKIKDEYIKLGQAMKLAGLVSEVKVGGEVCTQRGKKLYEGDVFSFEGEDYVVVHS